MKSVVVSGLKKHAGYAACVILLPFVVLLYQYQQNIEYLSLWHVLLVCCTAAVFLLVIFLISLFLFKSNPGAFIFTVIIFISFFMYREILYHFESILVRLRVPEPIFIELVKYISWLSLAVLISYKT